METIMVKQLLNLPLQYVSDGDKSFFSNGKDFIGGFNTWKKKSSSITSFPLARSCGTGFAGVCSHGKIAKPISDNTSGKNCVFDLTPASLFQILGIDYAAA